MAAALKCIDENLETVFSLARFLHRA